MALNHVLKRTQQSDKKNRRKKMCRVNILMNERMNNFKSEKKEKNFIYNNK